MGTQNDFGRFVGNVRVEWIEKRRKMRLLERFAYIDPQDQQWAAPAGSIIDGASIPRTLWSYVGSPFVGAHRNASVVHDVACNQKTKPWRAVHQMFYSACRCGGVGKIRAKTMFAAVHYFGPRWGLDGMTAMRMVDPKTEQTNFDELMRYIENKDPSIEEIESFNRNR